MISYWCQPRRWALGGYQASLETDPVSRERRPLQAGKDLGSLTPATLSKKRIIGNFCKYLLVPTRNPQEI